MGLDRPSAGIALFLCLDKTAESYFERAVLKESTALFIDPYCRQKDLGFVPFVPFLMPQWSFHIYDKQDHLFFNLNTFYSNK